jgi:hypothetical protein
MPRSRRYSDLHQHAQRIGRSPGVGIAGRHQAGIAVARLVGRLAPAIDHGDLVTVFGQIIGRRDADHAGAEHAYLHNEPPETA